MSVPLSRIVILAFAVLVLGADETASHRHTKHRPAPTSTAIATCDGTPIIMQGMDCRKRHTGGEQQAAKRAARPRVTSRGSGVYLRPGTSKPTIAGAAPTVDWCLHSA